MFIRFVIDNFDPDSGRRQGLFKAARVLCDSGSLSERDDKLLGSIRDWFNDNLDRPTRLAISLRHNGRNQALSWFKHSADVHIAKMREFGGLLERYDMPVHMIKARRPGYILYEDEFQIAAYPFQDTPT